MASALYIIHVFYIKDIIITLLLLYGLQTDDIGEASGALEYLPGSHHQHFLCLDGTAPTRAFSEAIHSL